MATTHLISIGEYLGSTYRPDVDYIDGHIEERNLGDFDHADLQSGLSSLLRVRQRDWSIRVLTEVRVRVGATRFRIPDICILRAEAPRDPVVDQPPLLCIEILSPRDSVSAMRQRSQDYFNMGVPEVWIFDPATRIAYICKGGEMTEQREGLLRLAGSLVEVSVEDVFGTLDEA